MSNRIMNIKTFIIINIVFFIGCANERYIRAPYDPVVKIPKESIEKRRKDGDPIPVKMIAPEFPLEAIQKRISKGYVRLSYDIDENGHTNNIVISESMPPNVFDENALKAMRETIYEKSEFGFKAVEYIYHFELQI